MNKNYIGSALNYIDNIRLDDCFTKDNDLALMNGVQALVRLLIEQAKLDKDNGLVLSLIHI